MPWHIQSRIFHEIKRDTEKPLPLVQAKSRLLDLARCYADGFGVDRCASQMLNCFNAAAVRGDRFTTLMLIRLQESWTDSDGELLRSRAKLFLATNEAEPKPESWQGEGQGLQTYSEWEGIVKAAETLRTLPEEIYLCTLLQEMPKITRPQSIGRYLSTQAEENRESWWEMTTLLTANLEKLKGIDIAHKPEAETQNMLGETPLVAACANGWTPVVKMLLCLGVDASVTDNRGVNGLHYLWNVSDQNKPEVAGLLLHRGAELTQVGGAWVEDLYLQGTPLHWAIQMRSLSTIQLLLNAGADVDDSHWKLNPLELATRCYFPEVIELLLSHKREVSDVQSQHRPLSQSLKDIFTRHKSDRIARPGFSNHGSDAPNQSQSLSNAAFAVLERPSFFKTRYMHGRRYEDDVAGTLNVFARRGVDANEITKDGFGMLPLATHPEVDDVLFGIIIRHGINMHAVGKDGQTVVDWLVHAAGIASQSHSGTEQLAVRKLKTLAQSGYLFPERTRQGNSLLHTCTSENLPLFTEELIMNGFDIEARNRSESGYYPHGRRQKFDFSYGNATPLLSAANNGSLETLKVLLQHHAKTDVVLETMPSFLQFTPIMCATASGFPDVVDELLRQPSGTICLPEIDGEIGTLLNLPHHCMLGPFKRRQNMVRHLLWTCKHAIRKEDALHRTLAGLNPLHQAILAGDNASVRLLLDEGTDPEKPANMNPDNPMRRPLERGSFIVQDNEGVIRDIPVSVMLEQHGYHEPPPRTVPPPGSISSLHLAIVTRYSASHQPFSKAVMEALEDFQSNFSGKIISFTSADIVDGASQLPMLKANNAIVKMLLEHGMKPTFEDIAEMCREKDRGMLRLLMPTDDIRTRFLSEKDSAGRSLLNIAMESGDKRIIDFLNGEDDEFPLDEI
ncbi:uncharacterized protein Z519_06304 [Cladophialophora bantiana CBS 173.52]|uniref:Ankyrin n=1 Tax=Cladophialophora bantiana (strain ATCC 10958 / CBS 173.52 / CDC B-1940 / NIH 8579) TaxID=1442370 RepID=A0A0D2G147_CLAB1|nr:uncharacterized protein Z519_06304 [Cladophialophora bantiana CBS 173.52]KIW92457.1 hypothetical protein Z519_06304 [Cladophialophora bantiana CBS 173.52]